MRTALSASITVVVALIIIGLAPSVTKAGSSDQLGVLLTENEIEKVLRHGPWPTEQKIDFSNRVSGKKSAEEFGKLLFFDTRLSANGEISCATCHNPDLGWTDGKAKAGGLERLDRNTQSLFNVSGNRWFGWDGRNDSLWAHSIGPILDEREMGATPEHVAEVIRNDPNMIQHYRKVFGHSPDGRTAVDLVVDVAKSIAAFQETIVTAQSAFDRFRDALARKDLVAAATYPAAAQRGAALFTGRAQCNLCHIGARFSNDEFDDAGVPYFTSPGQVDRGRFQGILSLRASPYNLLGIYNDAPDRASGWATEQVAQNHRTFGQFKVPSLRHLTQTAPYMHNGSLKTLRDVVDHYSNIDLDRIHSDAVPVLKPLNLTEQESNDLVAFLESLSGPMSER